MGTTSHGIRYPESTSHTRTWEHWQALAADADGIFSVRVPVQGQGKMSGGTLTLGNALVNVPGTDVVLNLPTANAVALLTFSADFQTLGTSVGVGIVQVQIDGVDQTAPQAVFSGSNTTAGARAVCGQSLPWVFTAAGAHTLRLRAQVTGALGMRLTGLHTQLTALVLPY